MASVSVSHLILFIASIIVAASVAGTITNTVGELSESLDELGLDASQEVQTDIEIISDSGADSGIYSSDEITLYVKNTGSRQLPADATTIDVFVNGEYNTDTTLSVVDGNRWLPGDVAVLTIGQSLGTNEDVRVQVTIKGEREVFEFRT